MDNRIVNNKVRYEINRRNTEFFDGCFGFFKNGVCAGKFEYLNQKKSHEIRGFLKLL